MDFFGRPWAAFLCPGNGHLGVGGAVALETATLLEIGADPDDALKVLLVRRNTGTRADSPRTQAEGRRESRGNAGAAGNEEEHQCRATFTSKGNTRQPVLQKKMLHSRRATFTVA